MLDWNSRIASCRLCGSTPDATPNTYMEYVKIQAETNDAARTHRERKPARHIARRDNSRDLEARVPERALDVRVRPPEVREDHGVEARLLSSNVKSYIESECMDCNEGAGTCHLGSQRLEVLEQERQLGAARVLRAAQAATQRDRQLERGRLR